MESSARKTSPVLSVPALLVTLILFSLGPQLGSFDADEDGIPEVPIMISDGSDAAIVLPLLLHIQHTIFLPVARSMLPTDITDIPEDIRTDSGLNASTLPRFGPLLRC